MKKFPFFILLFSALVFFSNCDNEEESCDPPISLAQNIVGVWTVDGGPETAEFKADGTIIDSDDALLYLSVNDIELSEKSYTIISETEIEMMLESPDGFASATEDITVSKNDCDEIILVFSGGFSTTLTR